MNIKLIYISKNKSNNIEFLVEDYEKNKSFHKLQLNRIKK